MFLQFFLLHIYTLNNFELTNFRTFLGGFNSNIERAIYNQPLVELIIKNILNSITRKIYSKKYEHRWKLFSLLIIICYTWYQYYEGGSTKTETNQ